MMAQAPPTRDAPRRTQEERRAATRAALLDATIECLVEHGYTGTTTTRVVERAGLSRGAQVHHFATKAILVSEALRHLARRRMEAMREQARKLPPDADPADAADLIWRTNTGPLFVASLELWVAARTDPELREALIPVEREVIASTRGLLAELLGSRGIAVDEEALTLLITTIIGVGMQATLLSSRRAGEAAWESVRDRMIAMLEGGSI